MTTEYLISLLSDIWHDGTGCCQQVILSPEDAQAIITKLRAAEELATFVMQFHPDDGLDELHSAVEDYRAAGG
jgi:hypothetical protein